MAIRGIEPSYFAGMPTVQRDPRAGQPGEGYMQMPGQALSEIAARQERQREFDANQAFRAREQGFQEEQGRGSAARDQQRLAMYQQGEDRRQKQQDFENDRVKIADTRKLVQAMQQAINDGEDGIAEAFAAELRARGFKVQLNGQAPSPSTGTAASATAGPNMPGKGTSAGIAGAVRGAVATPVGAVTPEAVAGGNLVAATRQPSAADQQTSAELDQAERSIIPKLRGSSPAAPSAQDAALSNQLDQIEQRYVGGLSGQSPTPRPLLPGSRRSPLRTRAVQSDQLLSPGDPLNRIVQ